MIKVPIGRGLLSQPEFKKEPEKKATNDIEFKRILADQGKLFNNFDTRLSASGVGPIVTVTPPNGSTFYLLEAKGIGTTGGATALIRLRSTIDGVITDHKSDSQLTPHPFDVTVSGFSIVGNGTNTLEVRMHATGTNTEAEITGYLEPSATVGSRGSTSAL